MAGRQVQGDANLGVRIVGEIEKSVDRIDGTTVGPKSRMPGSAICGIFVRQPYGVADVRCAPMAEKSPNIIAIDCQIGGFVEAVDMPVAEIAPESVVILRVRGHPQSKRPRPRDVDTHVYSDRGGISRIDADRVVDAGFALTASRQEKRGDEQRYGAKTGGNHLYSVLRRE